MLLRTVLFLGVFCSSRGDAEIKFSATVQKEKFDSRNSTDDSNKLSPKIVGGVIVTNRTQFAYQVSIRYSKNHFCGGTIISEKHVLTAAHCCMDVKTGGLYPASAYKIVTGDLKLNKVDENTVTRTVKKIMIHPNYDRLTFANDVAVMKISGTFKKSKYVNSIRISDSAPKSSTKCVISGWGSTMQGGYISNELRSAIVPIVANKVCVTSYVLEDGMLCAGYLAGEIDACQGDSGGPLVCNNKVAGIVSWGYGCAIPGYPGVYSDVYYYHNWITDQINGASTIQLYNFGIFCLIINIFLHIIH